MLRSKLALRSSHTMRQQIPVPHVSAAWAAPITGWGNPGRSVVHRGSDIRDGYFDEKTQNHCYQVFVPAVWVPGVTMKSLACVQWLDGFLDGNGACSCLVTPVTGVVRVKNTAPLDVSISARVLESLIAGERPRRFLRGSKPRLAQPEREIVYQEEIRLDVDQIAMAIAVLDWAGLTSLLEFPYTFDFAVMEINAVHREEEAIDMNSRKDSGVERVYWSGTTEVLLSQVDSMLRVTLYGGQGSTFQNSRECSRASQGTRYIFELLSGIQPGMRHEHGAWLDLV